MRSLEAVNLGLLALLPVAWSAPLLKASLLPFFGAEEISILSGVAALWNADPALAILVALLALAAPAAKGAALAALLRGWLSPRAGPWLEALGRLAMADVFLVAVYIVAVKGVGVGAVEPGWGLYLYTALVLGGMAVARVATQRGDR
jgi:uncharacterized paraquat-inducible protein A